MKVYLNRYTYVVCVAPSHTVAKIYVEREDIFSVLKKMLFCISLTATNVQ